MFSIFLADVISGKLSFVQSVSYKQIVVDRCYCIPGSRTYRSVRLYSVKTLKCYNCFFCSVTEISRRRYAGYLFKIERNIIKIFLQKSYYLTLRAAAKRDPGIWIYCTVEVFKGDGFYKPEICTVESIVGLKIYCSAYWNFKKSLEGFYRIFGFRSKYTVNFDTWNFFVKFRKIIEKILNVPYS